MISTAAGPRLPHPLVADQLYQVEDELGKELVALRAAAEAADPSPKAQEHAAEVAAVDDGEKAVEPTPEKKSESTFDKLKKPPAKSEAAKK